MQSGKQVRADVLLWANGRTGNTRDLGLEALPIEPDSRGYLKTNEHFQTEIPHIYAVGDVVGFPSLASAAYTQTMATAMSTPRIPKYIRPRCGRRAGSLRRLIR